MFKYDILKKFPSMSFLNNVDIKRVAVYKSSDMRYDIKSKNISIFIDYD
ncbi:MAG: hypothetical protein ACD_7C00581G0019, partial [uncultured bacterium]